MEVLKLRVLIHGWSLKFESCWYPCDPTQKGRDHDSQHCIRSCRTDHCHDAMAPFSGSESQRPTQPTFGRARQPRRAGIQRAGAYRHPLNVGNLGVWADLYVAWSDGIRAGCGVRLVRLAARYAFILFEGRDASANSFVATPAWDTACRLVVNVL